MAVGETHVGIDFVRGVGQQQRVRVESHFWNRFYSLHLDRVGWLTCATTLPAACDGLIRDVQCSIVSRFLRDKGEQYQCDTEFE